MESARKMHYKLLELFKIVFVETNPIPVKAAMAMMGMIQEEIRLPLTPLSSQHRPKLKTALERYGILETSKKMAGARK